MSALATRLRPHLARLAPPPDADLLGRFVRDRDGEAFAELVRRHGPAVLAVCRRLTRDTHLADDTFQAVFLVLARRAAAVRRGEPLGAWLYGVAVRVARKAAARAGRRREVVGLAADVPARPAEPFDADAVAAVLAEVGRLSAKYRAAVVLCELEGRSRPAAARELGIAEGTLSSRLAAARKALAARLSARGFAPAALAALAAVHVPRALASATSALATGAPAPAAVAALAHGVGPAMIRPPLFLAAVVSAALAAGLLAAPPAPDAPPVAVAVAQPPAAKAAPRPLPKGPNKILVNNNGKLVLIDPDGKNATPVFDDSPVTTPSALAKLSPDGTRVAFLQPVKRADGAPPHQRQRQKLVIRSVGGKGPVIDTDAVCDVHAWSPDGTKLAACAVHEQENPIPQMSPFLVDAATGRTTPLKLPAGHLVTGWLTGDKLLTTGFGGTEAAPRMRLHAMNLDGTEHTALTGENTLVMAGLPSPDGARVLLCFEVTPPARAGLGQEKHTVVVLNAVTGKRTPLDGLPLNGEVQGVCWSPDGTKIAYTWRQVHEGTTDERLRKETEAHLVVADWDGRNPRTILSEKGGGQWEVDLGFPDWR